MTTYPTLPNTLVIGFGHKARQGKDVAAQYIAEAYGAVGVRRYSFASALKATARVMFGMTKKDPELLQILGTNVFRKNNPDIWVQALYWAIAEDAPKVAVITDVRFPNEGDFIKSVGGNVFKVERVDDAGNQVIATDRDPHHPSEIALDSYTWDETLQAKTGDLYALQAAAGWAFVNAYFEKFNEMPFHDVASAIPQPAPRAA